VILWLRAIFETAYTFGFRLGELRSMRCHRIDLLSNTINLDTSKNGEPRTAYMTVAVRQLIAALVVGKKAGDFLFTRNGRKLGYFRKTWANTCVRAGVGHFHCPTCDEELTLVPGKQEHCKRRMAACRSAVSWSDLPRSAAQWRAWFDTDGSGSTHLHENFRPQNYFRFHRYAIVSRTELEAATRKLEVSQEPTAKY
jgi:hypothetical protein